MIHLTSPCYHKGYPTPPQPPSCPSGTPLTSREGGRGAATEAIRTASAMLLRSRPSAAAERPPLLEQPGGCCGEARTSGRDHSRHLGLGVGGQAVVGLPRFFRGGPGGG